MCRCKKCISGGSWRSRCAVGSLQRLKLFLELNSATSIASVPCHFAAFQPQIFIYLFLGSLSIRSIPPFSHRKKDGNSALIDVLKEFRHCREALKFWWEGLQEGEWLRCFHQWLVFILPLLGRAATSALLGGQSSGFTAEQARLRITEARALRFSLFWTRRSLLTDGEKAGG